MSPTILMLMGYLVWTLLLLFGVAISRFQAVGSGMHHLREITPNGEHLHPFAHRIHRAHLNCVENLPLLVTVCLIAFMLNQVSIIDPLAYLFLIFRVAQSLVHLYSLKLYAQLIRLVFFAGQLALLIYWLITLFAQN